VGISGPLTQSAQRAVTRGNDVDGNLGMGRLVQQRTPIQAIGNIPPAEAETNHYRTTLPSATLQMAEQAPH